LSRPLGGDPLIQTPEKFGADIVQSYVTAVDLCTRPFVIRTGDTEYRARSVIIATGASARLLGLPSERTLMGHGVSTCATCDGYFFRGHEIAVVGGGDSAMEEANFLTKFASKVTLVHRRDTLRASKIMQERAQKNSKIAFIWDSAVEEVYGEPKAGGVTGVKLKNLKTGKSSDFKCDGLFIAIGHEPNSKLFVGQLDQDPTGAFAAANASPF